MIRVLLTQQQAADRATVTTRTIRRWIYDGLLPAYRVGVWSVRVDAAGVDALITPYELDRP